jgi:hypothetical protein
MMVRVLRPVDADSLRRTGHEDGLTCWCRPTMIHAWQGRGRYQDRVRHRCDLRHRGWVH